MSKKRIARIWYEHDGYHVCDDELTYLDARGPGYPSKAAALRAAAEDGHTHAIGGGRSDDARVQAIPERYRDPI